MRRLVAVAVLLAAFTASEADVYFVEEIINPGFGRKKVGARRTRNRVYIKGRRQKVASTIETSKRAARALREQGRSLESSTILRLDKKQVYEIDLETQTYVERPAPPPDSTATARRAITDSAGPTIRFAVKEIGDSTRVAGIPCRHVVAQMRARYMDPRTGKVRRENRYTYDAWIATGFPGYPEIVAFQQSQQDSTSYPSLINGGLEQLTGAVDDLEQLEAELAALEGFAMRSTIRVTVRRAGKKGETEVFRLEREIKEFSHSPLADSVFTVPRAMKRVTGQ
jgi:hypothetical protein